MALSGVAHGNNRVMSKLGGELARLAGLAGFPSHGRHLDVTLSRHDPLYMHLKCIK